MGGGGRFFFARKINKKHRAIKTCLKARLFAERVWFFCTTEYINIDLQGREEEKYKKVWEDNLTVYLRKTKCESPKNVPLVIFQENGW